MRIACLMLIALAIDGVRVRAGDDVKKGSSSPKKPAAARCAAKSQSGAGCKRKTAEGSQYCSKHPDGVIDDTEAPAEGKPSKKSEKKALK